MNERPACRQEAIWSEEKGKETALESTDVFNKTLRKKKDFFGKKGYLLRPLASEKRNSFSESTPSWSRI